MLYAQRVRGGGWDKVISPFSPNCFLKKLESSSKFARVRGSSAGRQEIRVFALFWYHTVHLGNDNNRITGEILGKSQQFKHGHMRCSPVLRLTHVHGRADICVTIYPLAALVRRH